MISYIIEWIYYDPSKQTSELILLYYHRTIEKSDMFPINLSYFLYAKIIRQLNKAFHTRIISFSGTKISDKLSLFVQNSALPIKTMLLSHREYANNMRRHFDENNIRYPRSY